MVEGLYGCTLERNPYECGILIEFGFWEVCFTTSINHTTYTTAPVFQERGFEFLPMITAISLKFWCKYTFIFRNNKR